ncbi:MAG: hypothetical protein FWC77_03970 [Defluviitaleaceae bacterium]|nr:hypothetical protein [Defluviitaleaceae bacterium]
MRKIQKLIISLLATILVLICIPMTMRATVDGIWSGQFTIQVNGVSFELWGYSTDMAILYLCLYDMAYMLNGTSAQFNIRTPIDDRWDFWIVRGSPYTPTGTEFQPIPMRHATRADGGGLFSWSRDTGFDYYPEQTLVIGIDGTDEPATSIAIRTIQDIDNTYFMVTDLAAILGFDSLITTENWHPGRYHDDFVEGIDRILTTETHSPAELPVQSPEFTDIMIRISGQWVDTQHFYSPIINEGIVWPPELSISYHGVSEPVTNSVAPVRPEWSRKLWEWEWLWWYPVSIKTLESGLVEITVNQPEQAQAAWSAAVELEYSQEDSLSLPPRFENYRIVVDPREGPIENIMLYINDTAHTMQRLNHWDTATRHTIEPVYGGIGIMFRYIFSRWDIVRGEDVDFRIYRASVPAPADIMRSMRNISFDEIGGMELIHHQIGIAPHDRILFEFTDTTVEYGQVYYYSFWQVGSDWRHSITPGSTFSPYSIFIRVDVNEVLGIPESGNDEPAAAEPDTTEPNTEIYEAEPSDSTETDIQAESSSLANAEPSTGEPSNPSNNRWIWIPVSLIIIAGLTAWLMRRRFISS